MGGTRPVATDDDGKILQLDQADGPPPLFPVSSVRATLSASHAARSAP